MAEGDRLERIIRRLQQGKRLDVNPRDAADRDAILAAARLAGGREASPRLRADFRRRLAAGLVQESQPVLTRRHALLGGAALAVGALAGAGVERAASLVRPETEGRFLEPEPGRWFDVGALAELPERVAVRVTAGAVGAFLYRRGAHVTAVSSVCSHYPCDLGWEPTRSSLLCPCHGQRFTPLGQPLEGSYEMPPLTQIRVRLVDGRVQLLANG